MNDHDAMARLAAANPVPEPIAVPPSQAQFCLRTVLAQPPAPPGRRPLTRRRLVLAAAALAMIAGGTVVVTRPSPSPPPVRPVALPSAIFGAAAGLARQQPESGQFVRTAGTTARVVHLKSYNVIRVDSVESLQPAFGRPGEGWLAIGEQGSSVRPVTAADGVAHHRDGSPMPPRPTDLAPNLADDAELDGDVADLPDSPAAVTADGQGWLFRQCVQLLDTFTGSLSGAERARVFGILAGLTGVRTLDTATDPLGRPAVGLAYTGETPRYGLVDWQVYLRAGSDQIAYTQAVVRRPGPANRTLPPGAVQYSTAVTSVSYSDTP